MEYLLGKPLIVSISFYLLDGEVAIANGDTRVSMTSGLTHTIHVNSICMQVGLIPPRGDHDASHGDFFFPASTSRKHEDQVGQSLSLQGHGLCLCALTVTYSFEENCTWSSNHVCHAGPWLAYVDEREIRQ